MKEHLVTPLPLKKKSFLCALWQAELTPAHEWRRPHERKLRISQSLQEKTHSIFIQITIYNCLEKSYTWFSFFNFYSRSCLTGINQYWEYGLQFLKKDTQNLETDPGATKWEQIHVCITCLSYTFVLQITQMKSNTVQAQFTSSCNNYVQ